MPALPASPADEPTDAVLIALAQQGHGEAFAALVRRHVAHVRVFVAMKLPIAHLADEITHETFVFAFKNLAGLEVQTSFRAWLRAIAFNLVRYELQRYAREQQNLSRLEQESAQTLFGETERESLADEAAYLEQCLGLLPEEMRRLVDARYREGHSSDETAAAWQRTAEWVRVTLLRVRRQLRECIEKKMEAAHGH